MPTTLAVVDCTNHDSSEDSNPSNPSLTTPLTLPNNPSLETPLTPSHPQCQLTGASLPGRTGAPATAGPWTVRATGPAPTPYQDSAGNPARKLFQLFSETFILCFLRLFHFISL